MGRIPHPRLVVQKAARFRQPTEPRRVKRVLDQLADASDFLQARVDQLAHSPEIAHVLLVGVLQCLLALDCCLDLGAVFDEEGTSCDAR